MTRVDCSRCRGEGEVTGNPSEPFDPQAETSELCRTCNGTGYRDLDGFDADQDEWAEKGPFSDFPRSRRLTRTSPQADIGHHIEAAAHASPSSPCTPDVASPVTSGRGDHLPDAA